MLDLEEPVFSKLFTGDWEASSPGYEDLGAVIAATLEVCLNTSL